MKKSPTSESLIIFSSFSLCIFVKTDGGGIGLGIDNLYATAPAYYGPYDPLAYPATLGVFGQHDLASFPHFTTYGATLRSGLASQAASSIALNSFAANGVGLHGLNGGSYGYGGYGGYGGGYNGRMSQMGGMGGGMNQQQEKPKEIPVEVTVGKIMEQLKPELQLDALQEIAIANILTASIKSQGAIIKQEISQDDKVKEIQTLSELTDSKIKQLLTQSQKEKYKAMQEDAKNPKKMKKKKKDSSDSN